MVSVVDYKSNVFNYCKSHNISNKELCFANTNSSNTNITPLLSSNFPSELPVCRLPHIYVTSLYLMCVAICWWSPSSECKIQEFMDQEALKNFS